MKKFAYLALGATILASAATAEPVTRTTTYDGSKYEGTRVVTRDSATGTVTRDSDSTRKSDGATASRDYTRTRADGSVTAAGSETGFAGKTRSFDYARTRTDTGYTASGTATGRNGQTYALSGQGARTDTGYTRDKTITNGSGKTLYDRSVVATRADGQVSRNVETTRAQGFHPRQRFGFGRRR
ncbi:MAG: hypothetical protein ABI898_08245 [Sphingomonadales bacterium]